MAVNVGEIEATLRLRDEMTAQLQTAQKGVERAKAQMDTLGISTTEAAGTGAAFEGFAKDLDRHLGAAGDAIGLPGKGGFIDRLLNLKNVAVVAGAALVAAGKQGVDFAQEIQGLAERTGAGVEGLQQLSAAAAGLGTPFSAFSELVESFQSRLARGTKTTRDSIAELGLDLEALQNMPLDEAFAEWRNALSLVEDDTQLARNAAALLGDQWRDSAKFIKASTDEVSVSVSTMSAEQIAAIDRMVDSASSSWAGFARAAKTFFGQAAGEAAIFVERWSMVDGEIKASLIRIVADVATAGVRIVSAVRDIYLGVKEWLLDRFIGIVDSIKGKVDAVGEFFKKLKDDVVGNSYIPDMVIGIGEWIKRLDSVMVDPARRATAKTGSFFESMMQNVASVIQRAIQGGGNIAESIGASLGGSIFSQLGGVFDSETGLFGTGIGSFLQKKLGKTIGGALGSIIPGLGSLLGAGLGSLVGKIFGPGEGARVNDMRDQFMAAQGGLRAMQDQIAKFNNDPQLLAAFNRLYFTGKEGDFKAGMTAYEARLRELGQRAEKVAREIAEKFGTLGDAASPFGGVAPASLRPLVDELLQSTKLTAEQRLMLEALAQDPSWQTLQSKAEEYGIKLSALGTQFQQAKLSEIALGYARDLGMFMDAGADLTGVLEGMSDEISALVNQAIATKSALPETLRPYIEKLLEMGLLLDDKGEIRTGIDGLTFADIEDEALTAIRTVLEEIRDLLRGDLPAAAAAAAGGIRSAFDGIGDLQLPFRGGTVGQGLEAPAFAGGTKGRYLDFGAGTPAMLHGRERVMTEAEGRAEAGAMSAMAAELSAIKRLLMDLPSLMAVNTRDALAAARVR